MPKKVRPGSKRLPPWQTPQTQCRGSYSRKMSKKGVFEQAKDTFSLETTDAGWADNPMISTEQCPRLSIERRKHHAVRQRGGISFRFTSVTFSTARGSRSWSAAAAAAAPP